MLDSQILDLKEQLIFGWLYLRHHLGEALGFNDPEKVQLFCSAPLSEQVLARLAGGEGGFFPRDTRPSLQLVDLHRLRDGFLFRLREVEDSELSQLLAPGAGHLEVVVEVVDGSAWRLQTAERVARLLPGAALWPSRIDSVGRLLLNSDGRQVVVAPDGSLEPRSTIDEVPPRFRVEPESGHGRWYQVSDLSRALDWARYHSREEGQHYLVYDRESLAQAGELVVVFADGRVLEAV